MLSVTARSTGKRAVLALCVALIAQFACAVSQGTEEQREDDVRTLLSRYDAANSWRTRLSLNVKVSVSTSYPNPRYEGVNPELLECNVVFKRDGYRIDVSGWTIPLGGAAEFASDVRVKSVVNGNNWISYSAPRGVTSRTAIASRRVEESANGLLQAIEYGCILDGYFPAAGGRDVFSLLRAATRLEPVTQETIDGASCHIFAGRTPYGTIRLWIDRSTSAITRLSNERGPDDLWYDEKAVREHPAMSTYDGQTPVGYQVLVDGIVTQQFGEVFVPVSGVATVRTLLSARRDLVMKAVYSRSEIDVNPTFDAMSFQTDLSDGSVITYVDEPESGVVYAYHNKEIVKADVDYDPGSVPPVPKSTSRLAILASLFVALLALSAGLVLLYRRTSRAAR